MIFADFDAFVQRKMGMCNSFKAWQAGRLVDTRPGELTPVDWLLEGNTIATQSDITRPIFIRDDSDIP
jgi:hypothetical protein